MRDLVLAARIGVYPQEQQAAQPVRLNLDLAVAEGAAPPQRLADVVDYALLTARVRALVGAGHVLLVEQLAERVARLCLEDPRVRSARVRVEKLAAIADAAAVGVEIERRNRGHSSRAPRRSPPRRRPKVAGLSP